MLWTAAGRSRDLLPGVGGLPWRLLGSLQVSRDGFRAENGRGWEIRTTESGIFLIRVLGIAFWFKLHDFGGVGSWRVSNSLNSLSIPGKVSELFTARLKCGELNSNFKHRFILTQNA